MTVLVAAASKHGATQEIAEWIASVLNEHGVEAKAASIDEMPNVARYEAVVLGSAVYVGNWLEQARRFVEEHGGQLADRPTWLFSSGPIGTPPRPSDDEAVQIDSIIAATGAREHHLFSGKVDKSQLSFGERAVMFAFRAAEGDFRDWDEVADWAKSIAAALEALNSSDATPGGGSPALRPDAKSPAIGSCRA